MTSRCLRFGLIFAFACWICADDVIGDTTVAPKAPNYQSAGTITVKLAKFSGTDKSGTLTVRVPQVVPKATTGRSRRPQYKVDETEEILDLAENCKIRFHDLPKGADGKVPHYSNDELAKLREPLGTPGYRAEAKDLHPGQTVRLNLGKLGKDDKAVVTLIMILAEGPAPKDINKNDPAKGKKP